MCTSGDTGTSVASALQQTLVHTSRPCRVKKKPGWPSKRFNVFSDNLDTHVEMKTLFTSNHTNKQSSFKICHSWNLFILFTCMIHSVCFREMVKKAMLTLSNARKCYGQVTSEIFQMKDIE